jgi:DDE superfamily endonuclease
MKSQVEAALATRTEEDHRPVLILAQDEGRFGRINRPRACWAPPHIRPLAPAQVVREAVYVFAAVAPSIGKLCSLILPTVNTEMMNLFLQHVSTTFSSYFLVMQVDQAGWHLSQSLVIPENIRLIKQPPYSPEVNPVEHIWDEVREKYFHNRAFSSLDLLVDHLCVALNDLADDPARITSMTHFPHLQIAL